MSAFNSKSFAALDARLSSDDAKVRDAAAVEVWTRAFDDSTTYLLAKAARVKSESDRKFGERIGKSHGTVGNYRKAYGVAEFVEAVDVEHVAHAYTIVSNVKAAELKAWLATAPDEVADRSAWLLASDYRNLLPETETETETEETETDGEPVETDETVDGPSFEGWMHNVDTLITLIKQGAFDATETGKFWQKGVDLQRAVEGALGRTSAAVKA